MRTKIRLKDADALDIYRVALSNAESRPEITASLSEIGYDAETLKQGQNLLDETRQAFQANLATKGIQSTLYAIYAVKKEELDILYDLHRKKAKLVYRKDRGKADLLAISGILPRIYSKWVESVRNFYVVISADQAIQEELAKVKLTMDDINAGLAKIAEVEVARADYMNAKGDSQSSTQAKDASFIRIHDWMSAFYKAAKISLDNDPQRLEALGKIVRS